MNSSAQRAASSALAAIALLPFLGACGGGGDTDKAPTESVAPADQPATIPGLPDVASVQLDTLFAAANGDALEPMLAFLDRLGTRVIDAGRTPLSTALDPAFPDAGPRVAFACPDGGTFAVAAGAVSGIGPFFSTVLTACTIDDTTIDGTFLESSIINRTGGPSSRDVRVQDYRLVDAATDTRVTMSRGEMVLREPLAQDGGEFVPVRWTARDLVVDGIAIDYRASRQTTIWPEMIGTDVAASVGLEVTIENLVGGGFSDASVETVTDFLPDAAGGRFASGSLMIVDGSLIETLDADGGDPALFLLTIEQDGATTSYAIPWTATRDFTRPDTGPEN